MTGDGSNEWAPGGAMDGDFGAPIAVSDGARRAGRRQWRRPRGQRTVSPWIVGVVIVGLVVAMFVWPRSPQRSTPIDVEYASPSSDAPPITDADADDQVSTPESTPDVGATTTGPRSEPPPTAGSGPVGSVPGRAASDETGTRMARFDVPFERDVELQAVVLGVDGTVHEFDALVGTVRSTTADPIASGAPAFVFTDDDSIVVVAFDDVPGFELDAARSVSVIPPDEQPGGLLFPGPFANTAWQLDMVAPNAVGATLVDAGGVALGPKIDVDGELIGVDGRGNLVVGSAGGRYAVGAGPTTRLTEGDLLAVGSGHVVAYECSAELTCRDVRIDRASGERTALAAAVSEQLSPLDDSPATRLLGGGVSPDGGVAVIRVDDDEMVQRFVDLDTGSSVDVAYSFMPTPVVWSDDGRVALFATRTGLAFYDRDGSQVFELPDVGEVKAIAAPVVFAGGIDAGAADIVEIGSLFESGTAFENGAVIEAELLVGGAGS